MRKLVAYLILFTTIVTSYAQEGYREPTPSDVIFYIQHNRGKNTFFYQPNFTQAGSLDNKQPIIAKRQLFDNKGEIEPLSPVQKRYAYGISSTKEGDNVFDIRLAAYNKQKLLLKLDAKHKPFIETTVDGKYMIVKRLFIHQKEGTSGLNTKVDYILFYGQDKNGKEVQAKLFP